MLTTVPERPTLTDRQTECLNIIRRHWIEHGYWGRLSLHFLDAAQLADQAIDPTSRYLIVGATLQNMKRLVHLGGSTT